MQYHINAPEWTRPEVGCADAAAHALAETYGGSVVATYPTGLVILRFDDRDSEAVERDLDADESVIDYRVYPE